MNKWSPKWSVQRLVGFICQGLTGNTWFAILWWLVEELTVTKLTEYTNSGRKETQYSNVHCGNTQRGVPCAAYGALRALALHQMMPMHTVFFLCVGSCKLPCIPTYCTYVLDTQSKSHILSHKSCVPTYGAYLRSESRVRMSHVLRSHVRVYRRKHF